MGLTIHYSLRSTTRSTDEARKFVEQVRECALKLPFKRIGEIIELSGDACDFEKEAHEPEDHWLVIQANRSVERGDRYHNVPPTRLIAFSTLPGKGSEAANFGLCRYPRTIAIPSKSGPKNGPEQVVPTGLPSGWSWQSFCKTQYASNPDMGDVENFLRCHLSIVRLLDGARELGILHEVLDEGGYWEGRDVQALAREVAKWNAMIAGFAGAVKDILGPDRVRSEITKFPNFEHLEAEGRSDEMSSGDDDTDEDL